MTSNNFKRKLDVILLYQKMLILFVIAFLIFGITILGLYWKNNTNCKSQINLYTITSMIVLLHNMYFLTIRSNNTKKYMLLNILTFIGNIGLLIWNLIQFSKIGCLNNNIFLWIYTFVSLLINIIMTSIIMYLMRTTINNVQDDIYNTTAYVVDIIPENEVVILNNKFPVNIVATPINNI